MSKSLMGTAALAEALLSIGLTSSPLPATAYQPPSAFKKVTAPRQRDTQWIGQSAPDARESSAIPEVAAYAAPASLDRCTTSLEVLIGELRAAALMGKDWDGEGAEAPSWDSIFWAVSFARLLDESALLPESMIHPSGRMGLLWRVGGLYADLEFYPDGRIAFFAERGGERYKGVAKFDRKSLPPVFPALFRS